MKFERFISTFVMMNIVIMIVLVFSAKNDLMMSNAAEIFFGTKTDISYFTLPPEKQQVQTDEYSEIFKNTRIKQEQLDELKILPPYERAVAVVQMFSLMGDGTCGGHPSISMMINDAESKKGCSKDFARIFAALALYAGLDTRIVSNGSHYGAEIYDGKWIYIDPYFAMSASDENTRLSYAEFASAMLNNGWIKFNYFGGTDHCMSGKQPEEHPYFSDSGQFSSIYAYSAGDVFHTVRLESIYHSKPAFLKHISPMMNGAAAPYYHDLAAGAKSTVRKYVKVMAALIAVTIIATEIILPTYFITGVVVRRRKK
jgi:hypothetical protein